MHIMFIFIFILLSLLVFFLFFLLKKTKKQFLETKSQLAQLKDILYTAPHGYYFEYQTQEGIFCYCSDKLRLLFNITDKTSSFPELIKNINSQTYPSVLKSFYELKEAEKPFDEEITDENSKMHFVLNGRIIYSSFLKQKLYVVWVNNHSFEHQRFLLEQKETKTLSEKVHILSSALNLIPFPIEVKKGPLSLSNTFLKNNQENTGNFYWTEVKSTPNNEPPLLLKYGQDKTTEEGLQVLLKDAETTYKHLLKELPFGVALFDSTAKLKFFNSKFLNFWSLDVSFLKKEPSYSDILDKIQEKNLLLHIKDFAQYKKEALETFLNLTNTHEEFLYLSGNTIIKKTMLVAPQGGILILIEQK